MVCGFHTTFTVLIRMCIPSQYPHLSYTGPDFADAAEVAQKAVVLIEAAESAQGAYSEYVTLILSRISSNALVQMDLADQ